MARKPKVQGAASPSPGNASVEIVKDTVGDSPTPGIHDGLGGVHFKGDVVELPREIADLLIGKGFAIPADESSYIQAKERAKAIEDQNRQSFTKSVAVARMGGFDDMPPELRRLAQEHGDDIVALWQSGEDVADILKAYGARS